MCDSKSSVFSSEPDGCTHSREQVIDSAVHLFEHPSESFAEKGFVQECPVWRDGTVATPNTGVQRVSANARQRKSRRSTGAREKRGKRRATKLELTATGKGG